MRPCHNNRNENLSKLREPNQTTRRASVSLHHATIDNTGIPGGDAWQSRQFSTVESMRHCVGFYMVCRDKSLAEARYTIKPDSKKLEASKMLL